MDHDNLVEYLTEDLELSSKWDIVEPEVEYYSTDSDSMYFDNPIGEMDVMGIDLDEMEIIYLEAKTRSVDVDDGVDQLERAREFFEPLGYDFIGELYVAGEGLEEVVYSR